MLRFSIEFHLQYPVNYGAAVGKKESLCSVEVEGVASLNPFLILSIPSLSITFTGYSTGDYYSIYVLLLFFGFLLSVD